jgi:hypothetical protein
LRGEADKPARTELQRPLHEGQRAKRVAREVGQPVHRERDLHPIVCRRHYLVGHGDKFAGAWVGRYEERADLGSPGSFLLEEGRPLSLERLWCNERGPFDARVWAVRARTMGREDAHVPAFCEPCAPTVVSAAMRRKAAPTGKHAM